MLAQASGVLEVSTSGKTLTEITDRAVISASGSDRHPLVIVSANPGDAVEGQVFELTGAELASADDYEVEEYARVKVTLRSGLIAWAYVSAAQISADL